MQVIQQARICVDYIKNQEYKFSKITKKMSDEDSNTSVKNSDGEYQPTTQQAYLLDEQLQQIDEEDSEPQCLTLEEFRQLALKQYEYQQSKNIQIVKQLTAMYSDCICYFSQKDQNVSAYFQAKMKKILTEFNQSRKIKQEDLGIIINSRLSSSNQQKLNQNVMHFLKTSDVQSHIGQTMKKAQTMQSKIQNIIKQQQQSLQLRRQRGKKKGMSKSFSQTFSFQSTASLNPSPQSNKKSFHSVSKIQKQEQEFKQFIQNHIELFKQDLLQSDQEGFKLFKENEIKKQANKKLFKFNLKQVKFNSPNKLPQTQQ